MSLFHIILFQLPHKVIVDHVEEMRARIRSGDAVGFIGIDHQPELDAGLDERVDHLHAVLKMHIVIARAMRHQERAVQLRGIGRDVGLGIPLGVVFQLSHVTFGVDGVVVDLVGDGATATPARNRLEWVIA